MKSISTPTEARTVARVRGRRFLLSSALAGIVAGLLAPTAAQAADECGLTEQGAVTCTAADNPYPNGIEYYTPGSDPLRDPGLDPAAPVYDLTVNLSDGVRVQRAGGAGVALIGFNDGSVTLNSAPNTSIAVTGTGSVGVLANTNYGDLTINTESITASGRASAGINAVSNTGDILINAGSVAVAGNSGLGISANSYMGNVTINAGTVDATGYYSGGIDAYAANGNISISADRVTTSGGSFYTYGSNAIDATAGGGDITIDVGQVSTQADYSIGIRTVSFGDTGAVNVTADTIATDGIGSLGALIQGGSATLTAGSITTAGDGAYGAVMFSLGAGGATLNADSIVTSGDQAVGGFVKSYYGGDATVNVGTVNTAGAQSTGLYAFADTGAVSVTAGTVTTSGDNARGIFATTPGAGDVTVSAGTVNVSGAGSDAVVAIANEGNVSINVDNASTVGDNTFAVAGITLAGGDVSITSSGTISATGDYAVGVYAVAAGGGNASITVNNVSTDGFLSPAVFALGDTADVTVNGSVSTAYFASTAVVAQAVNGAATVTNNGSIRTSSGGGTGIYAFGSDGVTVTGAGTVSTLGGGASGIVAYGSAGSTIVRGSSIDTAGDYSRGVIAQGSGDVTVDVGSVTTDGRVANGIEAATFQNGTGPLDADLNLTVGTVTINGDYSQGINVFSSNNGVVNIDAGTVTVNGIDGVGILSQSFTADTTINVGSVITTGAGDAYNGPLGIQAISDTGNIVITSSNLVSTQGVNGTAIAALTNGNVAVTVNNVSTQGDNAPAIVAVGGAVTVTAGNVRTTGAGSNGIDAASFGGDVIVNAGSIRTSGADTTSIRALGFGGGTVVNVTGAVRSDSGVGVRMLATDVGGGGNIGLGDPAVDGIARLNVAAGAAISGGTDAVVIESVNGSQVNNAGTITGGSGYALRVVGASATINNGGVINGRLLLTGGNDTLNNTGTLTLTGTSDVGAGTDVLTNSGTIRIASTGAAQSVSVVGLEALNSSGLIDLRNGTVGDRLTFANTAYTGSGNAVLGLDVAFAGGVATADQLLLGSAAGSTAVSLGISGTPTLIAPTTIVDVTTGSNPTAFTIAPGSSDYGLITLGVTYNTADTSYQLVSAPSTAVYRQAQLGEALTTLWNRSADAVSARLAAGRDAARAADPNVDAGRLWFQAVGETDTRKSSRSFNFLGLVQNDVDLGYRQDAFGIQVGADVVGGSPEGGFTAGVTGGYLNSTTRFAAGNGDRFDVDAFNAGLYAGFRSGPFFLNGLAKYDWYKVDRRSYLDALNGSNDAHAWGGKVEAGLRLGSGRFFAEPLASLAYSRTSLDDFTVTGNRFDYDRFEGLRGKAGLRIGATTEVGGSTAAFYLGGAAVKEFEGRDGLTFTSGNQVIALRSDRLGTYGQATLGVNVTMTSGVSGFVEGHGEFGKEYRGGGGRAGLRVRF